MAMKVRDYKFLIGEGASNIWVNKIMSIASVGTVIACMVILGMFLIFSLNISYFATQLKAQFEIIVIVDENVLDTELANIKEKITAIPNISEALLVTKDKAFSELKQQVADNRGILDGLENPLRNSFRISIKNIKMSENTSAELSKIPGVAKVKNNKSLVDKILKITEIIRAVTFWFLIIFISMTVIIISNTIKVALFARRREINIMKFIGATDNFIRLPFFVEGILIGVIGGIISYILTINGYNYLYSLFSRDYFYLIHLVNIKEINIILILTFFIVSSLIGFLGSFISIRKHLNV